MVELVDRAERAGLVQRVHGPDDADRRVVRVTLTDEGERRMAGLAGVHLEELSRVGPRLSALWSRLPGGVEGVAQGRQATATGPTPKGKGCDGAGHGGDRWEVDVAGDVDDGRSGAEVVGGDGAGAAGGGDEDVGLAARRGAGRRRGR